MQSPPLSPLARLAPEPLGYATDRFVLREDLDHLVRVSRAGAPEAVILYCARILEAFAGDAIQRLGQEPSANVFSNLALLDHLNRMTTATRYWAHAVRRLGNQIRHVQRPIHEEEAELSLRLIERWLEWYFCRFSHGYRLRSLTRDGEPLGLAPRADDAQIVQTVESLETAATDPGQSVCPCLDACPAFLRTPVFPAAAAEILLARKQEGDALRILETGLSRFPDDLRLRQLLGIYWRRVGNLDAALGVLRPLAADSIRDEETAGIVASVFKQRWLNDRADRHSLAEAHRVYRGAWFGSGKKNGWVGINAATTAVYLGKWEAARHLAAEVEVLLRGRAARLPADLRDASLAFDYWDQVTLAEAQLIAGRRTDAEASYAAAFARHAHRPGDIDVSRRQKEELGRALDGTRA